MSITAGKGKQKSVLDCIYDEHSAKLYGIILKVSKNTNEAEEILTRSFRIFFLQNATPVINERIFLQLLKITMDVASEINNSPKPNMREILINELGKMRHTQLIMQSCDLSVR